MRLTTSQCRQIKETTENTNVKVGEDEAEKCREKRAGGGGVKMRCR